MTNIIDTLMRLKNTAMCKSETVQIDDRIISKLIKS